jgi:hypothetical protein
MTTRTFKQRGLGYGVEPLTIVAKINGVVAYEGPVTTVDEPLPSGPETEADWEKNVPLFEWTNTVDFEGTAEVEISVIGNGALMISRTVANYTPEVAKNSEGQNVISSSPDKYLSYFSMVTEDIVDADPYVDSTVDGVAVERIRDLNPDNLLTGQWFYTLHGGSTFAGTLRIQPGMEEGEGVAPNSTEGDNE